MTKEEKVQALINRIELSMRKLAKETGVDHISAILLGGTYMIDDYSNLENQKFSVFRMEENNE